MQVKEEYVTGNYLGFGASYRDTPAGVDSESNLAYKYGCYDSDGGDNIQTRGVVTYRTARQLWKQIDSCQDSKTLLEWACLGGGRTSEVGTNEVLLTRECTSSCVNGVCQNEIYREGQNYPLDQ